MGGGWVEWEEGGSSEEEGGSSEEEGGSSVECRIFFVTSLKLKLY